MLRAGTFRHRVKPQVLSSGVDEIGQPVQSWDDFITDTFDHMIAANVLYQSGIETIRAGAQSATAKASIRVRYRTDLTTAMRVLHGATVFQITAVLPDEQRREFVDLTVEVQS